MPFNWAFWCVFLFVASKWGSGRELVRDLRCHWPFYYYYYLIVMRDIHERMSIFIYCSCIAFKYNMFFFFFFSFESLQNSTRIACRFPLAETFLFPYNFHSWLIPPGFPFSYNQIQKTNTQKQNTINARCALNDAKSNWSWIDCMKLTRIRVEVYWHRWN